MKAIVFDNAGTILRRVTALKDMYTKNIIFETNTIGIVNKNEDSLILVFQTPTHELLKIDDTIVNYLKSHEDLFEIAYSTRKITKDEVIEALNDNPTRISEIESSAKALIENYDIEICSGSAIIVNLKEKQIDYVYTAGGLFFDGIKDIFKELTRDNFSIYIASGDNQESLTKIASILGVDEKHVFNTCNINCKQKVVETLQNKNNFVIMVGNHTNDSLALKQADIGILSIQQGEELPEKIFEMTDYVVDDIKKIVKIVKGEC